MKRLTLIAVVALLAALAGLAVAWREVWGPRARAMEVAEILAGRSWDPDRMPDETIPDQIRKWTFALRDRVGMTDEIHDVTWASLELTELGRHHPRALAFAAVREKSADVRFAFLDVIEGKPAWRDVPADIQRQHVTSHVVARLDRPDARPLDDAEKAALAGSPDESLEALRNQLVHGHCGALAGYSVLGATPQPDEIHAAVNSIAREAADPAAEMSATAQDNCRSMLAKLAAPRTDGNFVVGTPAP